MTKTLLHRTTDDMRLDPKYIFLFSVLCLVALSCQKTRPGDELHQIELLTEIQGFEDEGGTKVSDDGEHFVAGDWIRVKIICPYSGNWEIGESTYGGSVDDFYLLKYGYADKEATSLSWIPLTTSDGCDIDANYYHRGSPSLPGIYEAQPTPYVYTASTWSEEKIFKSPSGGIVNQFCNVFHADQSLQKNYRASDLLWAQQYMQTGSWNVRLSFRHVMSCIRFVIDDDALPDGKKIGTSPMLTLVGMPDIDQQEIVVGDYYAAKAKRNNDYGYRKIAACSYEENGKVLGICVNDLTTQKRSYCWHFDAADGQAEIRNTATYRAYKSGTGEFRLIVPPVNLGSTKAVVWLRDGERRFCKELDLVDFQQGKLYNVTIKLTKDDEQSNN